MTSFVHERGWVKHESLNRSQYNIVFIVDRAYYTGKAQRYNTRGEYIRGIEFDRL